MKNAADKKPIKPKCRIHRDAYLVKGWPVGEVPASFAYRLPGSWPLNGMLLVMHEIGQASRNFCLRIELGLNAA